MKNKIVFTGLVGVFFLTAGLAQDKSPGKTYTLQGQMTDQKPDSVCLDYFNSEGKYVHQVAPVENGKFIVSGPLSEPALAMLVFKNKDEKLSNHEVEARRNIIYLEPAMMTINAGPDAHGYLLITGSRSQAEWNELKYKTQAVQSAIDSLSAGLSHNASKADRLKLAPYQLQAANLSYAFFLSHPGSYVSVDRVRFNRYSLDSTKQLYNNLTPGLKESIAGRKLAADIKSREAGLPGTMAGAFAVKDKDGKELSLASFKGNYVLLDFWATWCVPCRQSMPHMISIYQQYKDKNFVMIGIGDDDRDREKWLAAIAKDGTGLWPQTLRGMNMEMTMRGTPNPRDLSLEYGVQALPTKILIDPEGKIIGRFTGSDDNGHDASMDKMLEELFKR